ncbi:MAG: homocysteine S-methyltransferase family protein [Actinomycetota bacterium]|nr:homocysteine S-methyltransferase family protein [Actinomycetota bacterium]
MSDLLQRLDGGEVVILDGAMGTELEWRGVPMDDAAWSAAALMTHPDTVREVHEDYIRAGADVITTNTFATARHVLEPAGMGEQFRELNVRAVALAKEARDAADGAVSIAGSISTFTARYDYSYEPRAEKARANYREQAEVLAESGVDVLALEMMRDIEQTTYAVEAAASTGLPLWIGFSCKTTEEGTVILWDGENTLVEALERVPLPGVSVASIMHTLIEHTPLALREVTSRWSGPVGAYPHSGEFIMPNWQFTDMISAEDFATEAEGWLELGARLVGGCCGIGPEHLRLLKERLPARPLSGE